MNQIKILQNNFPAPSGVDENPPVAHSPADVLEPNGGVVTKAAGGTLFDMPTTLSPRLIWMDKHGIWTQEIQGRWIAKSSIFESHGDTEFDALFGIAEIMGMQLWNQ